MLLGAALGCAPLNRPPVVGEAPPRVADGASERAYRETLDRFTAHSQVYATFDTRVFAAATFQAPAFREARARRWGEFRHAPASDVEATLERERAEAKQFHEFFLGAHFNDYRWEDLDKPTSIWRVALVLPEGEVTPVEIERLGRASWELRAYYPYLDSFWHAYRIRFPVNDASGAPLMPEDVKTVKLRLASSVGRAEFLCQAR
ncbi:MAG: hypothetical protein ACKVPX_16045 [Myxococcaceae bacterium]